MRFPYGNSYGWGIKHFIKSKHICDIFAEKDAFTVMLRLTTIQFNAIYSSMGEDAKLLIDENYACGEGDWIHFRILTEQHLTYVKKMLDTKVKK